MLRCSFASSVLAVLLALSTPLTITLRAQQAGTPKPPSVPIVNRANEVLPPWLRVRGEFRERMEGFTGAGFTEDRDDLYWLSRFRLNATVTVAKQLAFTAQLQDARVARKQIGPTGAPFRGPLDLRAAYADVGDMQKGVVSARVGRQEIAFGDHRLVGHLNWTNTARTFDAARVMVRRGSFTVDAFAASVVRIEQREFDKSGNGNRFFGAYGAFGRLIPKSLLEPYVFYRADRNLTTESGTPGSLGTTTAGARWVGQAPARLDYNVEMAAQTGSLGSDAVGAWAGHWQLRESLGGPLALRAIGEFNYATGDENAADGRRGTFDQLYPTGHDKYGLADQIGWRNIRHVRAGLELTPVKTVALTTSYHSWWLAEKADALYNSSGAVIARVAAGAAHTHVGQEIDVQAARALTPQIQLSGGYAYLFPGAFLEEATPGSGYGYPYVMVTYLLLADR
jgi:alginate export protein